MSLDATCVRGERGTLGRNAPALTTNKEQPQTQTLTPSRRGLRGFKVRLYVLFKVHEIFESEHQYFSYRNFRLIESRIFSD